MLPFRVLDVGDSQERLSYHQVHLHVRTHGERGISEDSVAATQKGRTEIILYSITNVARLRCSRPSSKQPD